MPARSYILLIGENTSLISLNRTLSSQNIMRFAMRVSIMHDSRDGMLSRDKHTFRTHAFSETKFTISCIVRVESLSRDSSYLCIFT